MSFYQRKEIKDIIAYFRLAVNNYDEEALRRVINYPARGIGSTTPTQTVAPTAPVAPTAQVTEPAPVTTAGPIVDPVAPVSVAAPTVDVDGFYADLD